MNQQAQYEQARKLMGEHKWNESSAVLEHLYELDLEGVDDLPADQAQVEVNLMLVRSLYLDGQFQTALQYANEMRRIYFLTENTVRLMTDVLLANHEFIESRVFVQAIKAGPLNTLHAELFDQIEQAENQLRTEMPETLKTNFRHFIHLGDEPLHGQLSRFEAAKKLPQDEYVSGAQTILIDSDVSELIKSSLARLLTEIGYPNEIDFLWIDGKKHHFTPDQVKPMNLQTGYQQTIAAYNDILGNDDPTALETVLADFQMKMTFTYPFADEILFNPEAWARFSIEQITGRPSQLENVDSSALLYWWNLISDVQEKFFHDSGKI